MVTSKYEKYRTISVNYKNIICADVNGKNNCFENRQLEELLDFIIYKVSKCIKMLEYNTYNEYIANNLSYKNRFGRHPWKIMRGHSFNRLNLYILHDKNGYFLSLDDNRILRKIEIAKIYLVLKHESIPIQIYNVAVIKRALLEMII